MKMKIEDLLNITAGTLVNNPVIHTISSATIFPSKVEEGDLFLANSIEDIPSAIANGAYAIMFEGDTTHISIDSEIAWIRVDSLKDAAFRLLRYVLLHKDADFVLLREHEMSFLKMILTHKNSISILPDSWVKAFEIILNSDKRLFVGSDSKLLQTIVPDIEYLYKEADGYIISDTLFRTTFKVDGYIYQDKEIAPFHLDYLLRVIPVCKNYQLQYSLDKIKYTKHFQPVFVDSRLHSVPKGSSERVIIFVDNIDDIIKARAYIKEQSRWVKSIVLTPPNTKIPDIDRPFWFETPKDAKEILVNRHFNYAFVYSLNKEMLQNMQEQYTLF